MAGLLEILAGEEFRTICTDITRDRVTGDDLYSYVVLTLHDKELDLDGVEEVRKYFYKTAYNTYHWKNSGFNRAYRARDNKVVSFSDCPEYFEPEYNEEPRSETYYLRLDQMKSELDKPQESDRDFMVREVTRLYLDMGSFEKVANATKLNKRTVIRLYREFVNDVRNSNNIDFSL